MKRGEHLTQGAMGKIAEQASIHLAAAYADKKWVAKVLEAYAFHHNMTHAEEAWLADEVAKRLK